MATLDNFFAKRSRPPASARNASEDAACDATCFEPKIISVEGSFHDHCDSNEKLPLKRVRHDGSNSDRLKTRKKQKVVGDLKDRNENENENFKQDELETDCKLQTADDGISEDCAETINQQSLHEISYEDFLAANEASCKEVEPTPVNEEDQDQDVTVIELGHTVAVINEDKASYLDSKEKLAYVSSDDKDEQSSTVPASSVASKDIRSFFGKTTANAASQNRPKSCATTMKVKAEVHVEPSMNTTIIANKPSTDKNRRIDLARWQRANIVITNADLEIEVIDICNTSSDTKADKRNTDIVGESINVDEETSPRSQAKLPEMPAVETASYNGSASVPVVDPSKVGRKAQQKISANVSNKKSGNELLAQKSDCSTRKSDGSDCHILKQAAIAASACTAMVITDDTDAQIPDTEAVDSNCDQTTKEKLQRYLFMLTLNLDLCGYLSRNKLLTV
jgi:hypothetical protein